MENSNFKNDINERIKKLQIMLLKLLLKNYNLIKLFLCQKNPTITWQRK